MPREGTIDCDVLVAGSGAGGMAAAVTARKHGLDVVVAEKEPWFGGTTALSGGWLWVPGNRPGARLSEQAGATEPPAPRAPTCKINAAPGSTRRASTPSSPPARAWSSSSCARPRCSSSAR